MQPQQLELLGERLLRAGIAPRHVRRYLRELRDHYDDAVQGELHKGASRAAAEETAALRVGEPESLFRSALARPELRSTVARYPRLVFGAGPMLLWAAFFITALFMFAEAAISLERMRAMHLMMTFFARVFPVVLALGLFVVAYRQRLPLFWPTVGASVVAILAGTLDIGYWPAQTVAESSVGISSSLMPFFFDAPWIGPAQPVALAQGLMRALLMLALAIGPCILWNRQQKLG
jgi:hypothetical protein